MDADFPWALLTPLLALSIPLTFGLASVGSIERAERPFALPGWASSIAALLAAAAIGSSALSPSSPEAPSLGVRLDVPGSLMLALVVTLGFVVVRYSRTYLDGDPGRARYARWLMATLAAISLLVVTDHLLVIAAAWMAASLALHQLLTFYPNRPGALVAAHKKFLLSRLADACVFGAVALVGFTTGTLALDAVDGWVNAHGFAPGLVAAALLLVVAVVLKSAQLPFHGWLTQVMEAPTPVSALLHAGIVNVGGFVMIRLASFMAHAPAAMGLLIVAGTTTTVVAALVMTTRPSVKASLAWSTCAQMGFMLVQCGLGAWDLALLHLVAHSLYKAHAFLSAGRAVDDWRRKASTPAREAPTLRALAASGLAATAAVLGVLGAATLALDLEIDASSAALALFVGVSLTTLVERGARGGVGALARTSARAIAVTVLYFGWHAAFARALPTAAFAPSAASWAVVGLGFGALVGLQATLLARPNGALARSLHPTLAAGLYLDDLFTRATFLLWPPRLPPRAPSGRRHVVEIQEVG